MRPPLTPRERQVARLVAEHKSGREIARELKISEHTVRDYITRIGRVIPGEGSPMRRIATWWVEQAPPEQAPQK